MRTDYTNKRFNRLVIISDAPSQKRANGSSSRRRVICRCDCGVIKNIDLQSIKDGKTKSCGCLNDENKKIPHTTHGLSYNPLYQVWYDMKNRCSNQKCNHYQYYGGRGISVCDEWSNSLQSFIEWASENGYKKGLQLDRINSNGNYEPCNCRFISLKENMRNRRSGVKCEYNGETKTLVEWCELLNLEYELVRTRLKRGWSFKTSVETPKMKSHV